MKKVPVVVESESRHGVRGMSREAARQLKRLREACAALPECTEKMSHGSPCFWAGSVVEPRRAGSAGAKGASAAGAKGAGAVKISGKVFASFDNDHHGAGHVAVWIPAAPGLQEALIEEAPEVYFRPPYVGCKGWVGIELARVSDEVLAGHLREAWGMMAGRKKGR